MIQHHTKTKGDLGLCKIMAAFLVHDIQVALPISEHLPFDMIAISNEGKLLRISVKYRQEIEGKLQFQLNSSWSNSSGCQSRAVERSEIDGFAIYCPTTDECYFVGHSDFKGKTITVRNWWPEGMEQRPVLLGKDLLNPNRLFGGSAETVSCTSLLN